MSTILPKELFIALLDNALHFQNSERNIEANWHGFWAETFFSARNSATHALQGLVLHPQYPLIQWQTIRNRSVRLELSRSVEASTQATMGDIKQAKTRMQPKKGHLVPGDQPRPTGLKGVLLAPASIAQRLQSTRKPASDSSGPSTIPKALPRDPISHPDPSPEDFPVRASPPSESTSPAPPFNAETLHRSFLDSDFTVDYALYRIRGPIPDNPTYTLFGHRSQRRNVHIPIVLELKLAPSRSRFGGAFDDLFRLSLSTELRKAYEDFHLKAPVIFKVHPQQQSIIALAAAGYWWSFSLIRKGDTQVEWSKAYVCGQGHHDALLRKLYAAAEHSPDDPGSFQDGWIGQHIHRERRTRYNEQDCMAANTIALLGVD